MQVHKLVLGEMLVNTYIMHPKDSKEAVVIDPGSEDVSLIMDYIRENELNVKYILLTHGHFDHIMGIDALRKEIDAPVCVHSADKDMLTSAELNLSPYMGYDYSFQPADQILEDGQIIEFGGAKFEVLHTPGHSPGGVCFYCAETETLVSGDTLFHGSVGRTDLAGGDRDVLMQSFRKKIWDLPHDMNVYPGHGHETTLFRERIRNPHLRKFLRQG